MPYTTKVRVYYEDTDLGGVVYHSNYLKFCERARTDFVREVLRFSQSKLLQEQGQAFVVSGLECAFRKPARFEQLLSVSCTPVRLTPARCDMYQEIRDESGGVLFTLKCSLAMIDVKSGRPLRICSEFADGIREHLAQGDLEQGS